MIDAEKLLGALLRQGLRSGRRGRRSRRRRSGWGRMLSRSGLGGAAGLGLLGVAIAAYDHFTQKANQPSGSPTPPGSGPPPPPPPAMAGSIPPPPPAPRDGQESSQSQAVLLIRAMIAAANADGVIDERERAAILERLEEAGMTAEERQFIETELAVPPGIENLILQVDSPELAQQVYAASLLAIEVDTEAEKQYLDDLRRKLDLDQSTADEIYAKLTTE